jgi:voltage-gated potassium channel Kch
MAKNKSTFRERFQYSFDRVMSLGTLPLVGILFFFIVAIAVLTGIIAGYLSDEFTVVDLTWTSFLSMLDASNLADVRAGSVWLVVWMVIVTLCGLVATSILIGIIVSGFEAKLYSLRRGFSRVLESDHIVVIGFNDKLYTLLEELILANANHKKACVVVVDERDKEEIEEQIQQHLENTGSTSIVVRSGSFTNHAILQMASLETAGGIIINLEEDYAVVKAILAVTTYLKAADAFDENTNISALVQHKRNLEAARIAGENRTEVIYCTEAMAKIIANTCREPGLSAVLVELLSFKGNEIYFERFPALEGLRFGDILNLFEKSTVLGLMHEGEPLLNPPSATVLAAGDGIIHLAEDDNISFPQAYSAARGEEDAAARRQLEVGNDSREKPRYNVLILGYNMGLYQILEVMERFAAAGSTVLVASDSLPQGIEERIDCSALEVSFLREDIYQGELLSSLLTQGGFKDILLLSSVTQNDEEADGKMMMLLLLLKEIAHNMGRDFNITSEMQSAENQKLVIDANVSDFVVGSTVKALLLTQMSQKREIYKVFCELLEEEGSELYFHPADRYVRPGTSISVRVLTAIAAERREIFVGYKKVSGNQFEVRMNLPKSEEISFGEQDCVLVVAKD